MLSSYLGLAPKGLEFGYGAGGKPFLRSPSCLRFSSASSGDLAVIAIVQQSEIGVDVEQVREFDDALGIARVALTAGNAAELTRSADRTRGFLELWTKREAIAKQSGRGIAVTDRREDDAAVTSWQVDVGSDYVASLAIEGETADRIRRVESRYWNHAQSQ
jgi:4'-phosphopantetheinyl transferase